MRRLLQRIEDGLYYQGRGAWTEDPENALVFTKTSGAIECCLKEHLPQVQLVLKFEDSVFDIRLPCCPTAEEVSAARTSKSRRGAKGRSTVT
jgi:hypothetical protein